MKQKKQKQFPELYELDYFNTILGQEHCDFSEVK